MKKATENKLAVESSVQIENIKFHILIDLQSKRDGARPAHETLLHKHVFYEMFVCKKGEIGIKTDDGDILLSTKDIAIIPPTKPHVLKYTAPDTERYTISFICHKIGEKNRIDIYKKLARLINGDIRIFQNRPEFISEAEKIVKEAFSADGEKFLTAMHFLELFLKMANANTVINDDEAKKKEITPNDIERMMKIDVILANRYLQKYSTQDYANELFISARQLDRIAIKRYGKSLHQLIVDRRFALAEQLLKSADLTVEEVASSAGFTSSASLYREFKKRLGTTPTDFRKTL